MRIIFTLIALSFIALPVWAESPASENRKDKQIKPALLVIDVQNEYLPYMSEQDKTTAMRMINGCLVIPAKKPAGYPRI